ncbi:MAG: hypothetical protein J6A24_02380 [Clostridia bacterium]|nr:hypothetical protein [Clostridia bacterium]
MLNVENGCVDCACESALENAWKILTASKKRNFVVVQIAPAVRVSIGEKFGLTRGEDSVGKVVAVLELLGADAVVDTAIASDAITLMKLKKVRQNKETGAGTVYSSECPGWRRHAKKNYPEIELLPTATSVCAKLLKKYYSEAEPGKKIRVIALEMGKGKKDEPGVDLALTLDELGILVNSLETSVRLLKKKPLATPLGIGSGASYIAAASGGDAEALARCLTTEKNQLHYRKFEYSGLYGKGSRREAVMTLGGEEWKFAVVDSVAAADALLADIEAGARYDYVEITACAGGQIGKGCDLSTEQGEMTRRLRHLGLKYLDRARAARSAETNAPAAALLKSWNALCRSGEAAAYDVIDEIVEDFDEVEEIVEEPVEEVVEETPVEETVEEPVEETPVEVVEEVVEETPEEVVEEVVEETPVEEVVEVVEETPVEEVVEEVVEETPVEVVEEVVEETPEEVVEEVVEETPVEEVVEEVVEETPVEVVEEVVEETPVEEVVEEVAATETEVVEEVAEEPVVEEVVEETPIEEPVEEVVEEPVVEEVAEEPIVEEVVEAVVEEAPVEEPVEEVVEEPVVEEVAEEAPVEEEPEEEVVLTADKEAELMQQVSAEELAEEMKHVEELLDVAEEDLTLAQKLARAHYYRRLSTKERRKLKRLRKKMKNGKNRK